MKEFYSNGKLLITGEYFVLEGAKSLAVPTSFGQRLEISPIESAQLVWKSFTFSGECWLEAIFELPKLRLVSATHDAEEDGGNDRLAENLFEILLEIRKMNPSFLKDDKGLLAKTVLDFPRDWGLGSSSTLINNLSEWADVNPYELLRNTFGGSGYDIAAAQNDSPIFYTRTLQDPIVEQVSFDPDFKDQLYFVHLNQKQNSRAGIKRFNEMKGSIAMEIAQISSLTDEIVTVSNLESFEKIVHEHEKIVASVLKNKPIQEIVFSDYFGQVKSLGAWGGDFVLATGNDDSLAYFKSKGFETIIPYSKMVL